MPFIDSPSTGHIVTEQQLAPFIASWNAREWADAAAGLASLEQAVPPETPLLATLRHLRGIALNFHGQYDAAKPLFVEPLRQWNAQPDSLKRSERGAASWLAISYLLSRKWDEAALSWAISCSNVTVCGAAPDAASNQALQYLTLYQEGKFTGKSGQMKTWAGFLGQCSNEEGNSLLPSLLLTAKSKASFFNAALVHVNSDISKEELAVSPEEAPRLLAISASDLLSEDPWSAIPILMNDPTLFLDPRPYNYLFPHGLDITPKQMSYRFLNKTHFPTINLTALYTSSRPLSWMVDSLTTGLADLGFMTHQYWDRIRAVRVRECGPDSMRYVASFVIVFHKWVALEKYGVQIPVHHIRDDWRIVRTPAPWVFPKLCADVKDLLKRAEAATSEMEEAGDEVASLRGRSSGAGADIYPGGAARTASNATSKRSLLGSGGRRFWSGSGAPSRAMSQSSLTSAEGGMERGMPVASAERV